MSYAALTAQLQLYAPALGDLAEVLPDMPLELRKALITLARCQTRPMPNYRCLSRLSGQMSHHFLLPHTTLGTFHMVTLCRNLHALESPILSGFVSMLVRNAPFNDYGPVEEALWKSVHKEIAAAVEPYEPIPLNWSSVFSASSLDRHTPLAPGYPCDPVISGTLHSFLRRARDSLRNTTLYPDYSSKTIGWKARYNLEQMQRSLGVFPLDPMSGSTKDLEYLYHKFGVQIGGETEIRWAWKYNDLKPRMYYARGPDVYYASRYIQTIMNTFIDSLPCTNRFSRYFHNSIRVDRLADLFIYDYESFTSLLDSLKTFTRELADFCRGTIVTLVDTHEGPKEVDLGELIWQFNETCNMFPKFDRSKLMGDLQSDDHFSYHTCGMLGVPGNISSSTLLHGLHLVIVVQDLACKCVGDDALAQGKVEDRSELCSMLQTIGRIEESKMEFWTADDEALKAMELENGDSTWQYCKRPLDRVDTRIHTAEQFVFPPVAILAQWSDPIHTIPKAPSERLRLRKCASMLCAFGRQFHDVVIEDDELETINAILRFYLTSSGLMKNRIDLSSLASEMSLVFPLRITNEGYFQDMEIIWWNCIVTVPVTTTDDPEEYFDGVDRLSKGRMFKALKLARDLGYADITERKRTFIVRDDPESFARFLSKTEKHVYEYCVTSEVPDWLLGLIQESVTSGNGDDLVEDPFDYYEYFGDLFEQEPYDVD